MNKHLHDFRKGGGLKGLFGEQRVPSASPPRADTGDGAVDVHLGPKIYFQFQLGRSFSL